MLHLPEYPHNSEGYCKDCRAPLGISGICAACELEKHKPLMSYITANYIEIEVHSNGKWRYEHSATMPFMNNEVVKLRERRVLWRIRRMHDNVILAQSKEAAR